jgi:hypothetical protein
MDGDFDSVDFRAYVNSAVYFCVLAFSGVSLWKTLIIAIIVLLATKYSYGRQVLLSGGIVLLFTGLAVWADIVPNPHEWGTIVKAMAMEFRVSASRL